MKIELTAEREIDDATVRRETGRSWDEWHAVLDAAGGPPKGRRELVNHIQGVQKIDPWWLVTIVVEYERARGVKEKDGLPRGYGICATKTVKTTPERCFEAFTSAPLLDSWLGPGHQVDLRPGGRIANADGNAATVKSFTQGKALRLIWEDASAPGTPVEVKLQPAGAGCTIMVMHERLQTRAHADGLRAAWGAALDRLKPVLEAA